MNRAVCITTWREFKANKVRVIMLTLLILGPILISTLRRCTVPEALNEDLLCHPSIALAFTLLWSAGAIGREVQNGTITLVLTRPITIANYVVSKWFAVGFAASICAVEAVFLEHLVTAVNCPQVLWSTEVLVNGFERVLLCFGIASLLVMFSALVSGLKDLALLAGCGFAFFLASAFSSMVHQWCREEHLSKLITFDPDLVTTLNRSFESLCAAIFYPYVPFSSLVSGSILTLSPLLSSLTLITICLSIAIGAMTRKEFSYAAD
jgi:hypothetical protein